MENTYKTVESVGNDYRKGAYSTKLPFPSVPYFKEGHVFDEEKSVRWNREEAERLKNEAEEQREEYRKEEGRLSVQLTDDVVEALIREYNFNKKQAEKIYSYAYSEKHSHMSDVFYFIEELADLYEDLQKLK